MPYCYTQYVYIISVYDDDYARRYIPSSLSPSTVKEELEPLNLAKSYL